jgi:hypothetical protein
MITARDIEREHQAALKSLTAEQRRALGRMAYARQRGCFNHRSMRENLAALFDREALGRSRAAAAAG